MATNIINHFRRKLAARGFPQDPGRLAEFQAMCAERDSAEAQALATGVTRVGGTRVDCRKHRLDTGYDRTAVRREIREAQIVQGFARQARTDSFVPQASQALISFTRQVYRIRHPGLTAFSGGYLDIDEGDDRAAEEIVWHETDLAGMPQAGSTYAIDSIPLVPGEIAATNVTRVVPFLVGFTVNFMDDRRSQLARRNNKPAFQAQQAKTNACHRVLAEAVNALWLWGDAEHEIPGLHTHSGFQVIQLPNGDWANATGDKIKDDLIFMITFIAEQSSDLEDYSKLRIALPDRWDRYARTKPVTTAGTGAAISAIKYAQETYNMRPDQFVRRSELAREKSRAYYGGPFNLSRDRGMVTYLDGGSTDEELSGDPKFCLPQRIELPQGPVPTGAGHTQYFHVRAGGVKAPDSRRLAWFVGFEQP